MKIVYLPSLPPQQISSNLPISSARPMPLDQNRNPATDHT
jgi:hypothetical protein